MSDPSTPLPDVHVQAEVLVQALPHMQRYDQQMVVIKYGGHAMGDRAAAEDFAEVPGLPGRHVFHQAEEVGAGRC